MITKFLGSRLNAIWVGFLIIAAVGCSSRTDGIRSTTVVNPELDVATASPPELPETLPTEEEYDIITLLPKDAIPAIDNPEFYSVEEADLEYTSEELVLGVSLNGESKAYSTSFLDRHEIVNDTVGRVKIAVTW